MKRTLVLILILAITNIQISCIKDDNYGCGGGTNTTKATISELSSSVGTFTKSGFSDAISNEYDVAAIRITISSMNRSKISALHNNSFSFINSAYACSPAEPAPTQAIESIIITSESSVFSQGKEYPKGENLIELFKVGYSYYNDGLTVNEFIERQNSDLWIFGYLGADAVFQLTSQPDSSINQSFTFLFEFSDSVKISIQTPTFEVKN